MVFRVRRDQYLNTEEFIEAVADALKGQLVISSKL
jgi:hypothetical protein